MFVAILFIIVTICVFWRTICDKVRFLYLILKMPAYPGALPVIGHAHLLLDQSESGPFKFIDKVSRYANKNGGLCTIWLKMQPHVECPIYGGERQDIEIQIEKKVNEANLVEIVKILTDPKDAFTVLTKSLEKNFIYSFIRPWFKGGLVTARVELWKNHRRILNPAFNPIVLNSFLEIFNNQARKLAQVFADKTGAGPFDATKDIVRINLETLCKTVLGNPAEGQKMLNEKYSMICEDVYKTLLKRTQNFWMYIDFIFYFTKLRREQDKIIGKLRDVSKNIIQKKKDELQAQKNKQPKNKSEEENVDKFEPLLRHMLELNETKDVFTKKQMLAHVDTFISAGYDTSSVTLSNMLVMIGSHQSVQEKLHEELSTVFNGSDRDVTKEDLMKLKYLEATVKETLRLHPTIAFMGRHTDRELKLEKYTLPKGSSCFVFLLGLHRGVWWGPDADEFKPERWLHPSTLPQHPAAFCGFSVGRRMCIGKSYALMSLKITLIHLLRKYRVSADHTKLQMRVDILMRPVSGHHIALEPL